MPRSLRKLEPFRWSTNSDVHAYSLRLCEDLHINTSVLIRMFILQLREGDPATVCRVDDFVGLGLQEAIVSPKPMKAFVEEDLLAWLKEYSSTLRHSKFSTRRVWPRHLLTGYILYLRRHEAECVKYGSIRLWEIPQAGEIHAERRS